FRTVCNVSISYSATMPFTPKFIQPFHLHTIFILSHHMSIYNNFEQWIKFFDVKLTKMQNIRLKQKKKALRKECLEIEK
ncbi:MAG: hypothetical protein MR360_00800, partial [Ruminococcus sp.]